GRVTGSACTSTFSRLARRSLALPPAHSRGHPFVTRYPEASDISSPPCLLRLLPAGAVAGWGLHPLESAALSRRTPRADVPSEWRSQQGHPPSPRKDSFRSPDSQAHTTGIGPACSAGT